jgi:hypothetical protein
MRRLIQVPALAILLLLVAATAATASTITVTRSDDPTGDQNCLGDDTSCSLRQAIDAENTTAGGDTIVLSDATYSLTQGTDIIATKPFNLQGAGVASTTIDGSQNASSAVFNPLARILRVDSGATVVIQGLTFTGGFDEQDETCSSGCSTINSSGGGDLFNNGGNVTLNGVAFTNNFSSATPLGGAVSNGSGSLTMNDVSFTHNAAGAGGALFTRSGTVSGNGVTFSDNQTTCCEGGAAYLLGGNVTLVNTTIASSGGFGGGEIANGGANLTLDNVTLSAAGSDIQTDQFATTTVENTILATPSGGPACVASGRPDSLNNGTTGGAITGDLGNNLAQDNSCGLLAAGDKSNIDPKLVPIADNGGPTHTQALLAGSPALGDPATTNCPAKDQRGDARPSGKCDIGAFEAALFGAPTATTGDVGIITDSSAKVTGTVNLAGEAGGFHFVYGTSQNDLSTRSDEVAAGVVSNDTTATETLSGLTPDTTYFFKTVADNASGSTPASTVESFTTQPGPPVLGDDVSVDSITDTTATVHFTLNPQGSDTTYFVEYGPNPNYGQQTQTVDVGAAPGAQQHSANLSGLTPNSPIHFDIVASNDVQQNVDSGDRFLHTLEGITGVTDQPVALTDSADTFACPTTENTTIDWADGSSDGGAQIQCSDDGEDGTDFQLSDSHIYTTPGDYNIVISYGDLNAETDAIAHISGNPTGPTGPSSGTQAPPGNQSPSGNPTSPLVGAANAQTVSVTSAGFSGSVTPNGLPTQAHFEYGLDPRYSGGGPIVYDHSTPAQSVGSDFSSHGVGPVAISGLLPNALYHVRLVASNSAGTTSGPDATFTTAAAPAPGAPIVGKTVNVTPVSGFVLIKINGRFVPLTGAEQIPSGSQIDARHGSLELITSTGQKGKTQHGTFGGAIFKLTQAHNGLATLKLVEGAFKGAPSFAICKAHKAADATIASTKTLQLLKASAHGKFRTKGRYSAATVRGTKWTVADRCDGTLTHVITDSVAVTDFVRHKTIILHAGQSYLARLRRTG